MLKPSAERHRHVEWDRQLLMLEGGQEMRCQIRGVMLRCSDIHLPLTPYRQA